MYPKRAASLAQVAFLDLEVGNLSAPEPLEASPGGLKIRRVRQAAHGLTLELLGIEAEHGAEGPVAMAITAAAVGESDPDRCVLDRIAEQRFCEPRAGLLEESLHLLSGNAFISAVHRLRPAVPYRCRSVRSGERARRGLRHMDARPGQRQRPQV